MLLVILLWTVGFISYKIGLWTGNGSSGRFRDLILTK